MLSPVSRQPPFWKVLAAQLGANGSLLLARILERAKSEPGKACVGIMGHINIRLLSENNDRRWFLAQSREELGAAAEAAC